HEAVATARAQVSNSRGAAPWRGAKSDAISKGRPPSRSSRPQEGPSGPCDVAGVATAAELSQRARVPRDSRSAGTDGASVVSRRALFRAARPHPSARGGGRQGFALARAEGRGDSARARRQSPGPAHGKGLGRSLPREGALFASGSEARAR